MTAPGPAAAVRSPPKNSGQPDRPPRPFRLFTLEELEQEPDPRDLIAGILGDDDLGALYGATGVGKTFAAIWIAVCVSEAVPFFGRAVRPGTVIYVALEGGRRIRYRLRAALRSLDLDRARQLYVMLDPLYPHMADCVVKYIKAVREQREGEPVALTIIDTLARASSGSNENSNADRELTIDGLRAIQRETGGAILAIGHTGWDESRLRGGYSLMAAADVVLKLEQDDSIGALALKVEKNREGEDGLSLPAKLTPLVGSCVFGPVEQQELLPMGQDLTKSARKALEALAAIALSDGVPANTWERATELPPRSFFRAKKQLVSGHLVESISRGRFAVSVEGQARLSAGQKPLRVAS